MNILRYIVIVSFVVTVLRQASAQTAQTGSVASNARWSTPIIVPQARRSLNLRPDAIRITEVRVGVEVLDQVGTTTMDISLTNPSRTLSEARMVVPVPAGAVLRGFTCEGNAAEPTAQLLPRAEARRLYDEIVARTRDPALLEFIGNNLIQSSVFPVQPQSTQKVRLVYEQLLPRDGDRVDYVLPRTESINYRVPWKIAVRIKSKDPIGAVYSPSHSVETVRQNENSATIRLTTKSETEPGPFRLSYLLRRQDVTASLFAYPDAKIGGGYFLFLTGAPERPSSEPLLKREVILVLDRSGSMAGEKLDQVRRSALQVLEGLEDGEAFNILVYNEYVESFAPETVIKNKESIIQAREYLRGIRVRGGTNIHDALQEALRMRTRDGFLPLVLFLTDGLPTIGQTSEKAIRDIAAKGNRHGRRVFTFGVGVDVNTPLLDKIAVETRATSTFVLPKEDVEIKVARVFRQLSGPVLIEPTLRIRGGDRGRITGRARDVLPARLPDLFEGDQLVLLGQYIGEEPLSFVMKGDYGGKRRTFRHPFNLDKATTRNAFVPRLWASRKIAFLTDAIRDLGAQGGSTFSQNSVTNDPRLKELVDEIVRLSQEFGILSEYTAFLAREGSDLSKSANVLTEAIKNFDDRAVKTRYGLAGVNQEFNNKLQRAQVQLNARNGYLDSNLNRIEITTVQQVNDKAFFKRGNRWIESSLVSQPGQRPAREVQIGSSEFRDLVERLTKENRPGVISLEGEILLRIDGETILVR